MEESSEESCSSEDEGDHRHGYEAGAEKTSKILPADISSILLFDCHCHLHDDFERRDRIAKLNVKGLCLMGVNEVDWPAVSKLATHSPQIIHPAFGLHPWFAHRRSSDWFSTLKKTLEETSHALIGEIGLDKAAKTRETGKCEFEQQKQVFVQQLELGGLLKRPVSVHCVRAFGDLFNVFNEFAELDTASQRNNKSEGNTPLKLPPLIMMHSFGGTVGMMQTLLKMKKQNLGERFYFSFSKCINMRAPKTRSVIRAVPDDRLLLESDMNTPQNNERLLLQMCRVMADEKGWTMEETARRTTENALRFFSVVSGAPHQPEKEKEKKSKNEEKFHVKLATGWTLTLPSESVFPEEDENDVGKEDLAREGEDNSSSEESDSEQD